MEFKLKNIEDLKRGRYCTLNRREMAKQKEREKLIKKMDSDKELLLKHINDEFIESIEEQIIDGQEFISYSFSSCFSEVIRWMNIKTHEPLIVCLKPIIDAYRIKDALIGGKINGDFYFSGTFHED